MIEIYTEKTSLQRDALFEIRIKMRKEKELDANEEWLN